MERPQTHPGRYPGCDCSDKELMESLSVNDNMMSLGAVLDACSVQPEGHHIVAVVVLVVSWLHYRHEYEFLVRLEVQWRLPHVHVVAPGRRW